ncbi:Mce family protein [Rhodococcus zopfii]|uniref:Mce family protein n=1 Tax=Rhodococcus zopfii TaxID=43772 RepID=UPI000934D981|nr:Mce family protein [Rhodococcus zopfii]
MSRSQDFLRGTAAEQSRRLATTGMATIAVLGVAAVAGATLYPKWTAPKGIDVAVDVAYVGPGVTEGTKVVLRGQSIGTVTELERTASESVQMHLVLDEDQIGGLTDRFELDFRPENYFGTSAVNLVAHPGGNPLASGMRLAREPQGDYTMSTMIEQGSLTIDGTLTDDMISSLDKTVHYLDGLTPWIDAGMEVADHVAATQQELPTVQIARFNDILDAMPGFSDQAIASLMNIYDSNYNRRADGSIGVDDAVFDEANAGLTLAANQLFGQAGALLASHGEELTPLIESVVVASDVFPHLVNGGMTPSAARDIVRRLDSTFVDTPDGQRLRLRVLVDGFPSFTAPLGLGAAPATEGGER